MFSGKVMRSFGETSCGTTYFALIARSRYWSSAAKTVPSGGMKSRSSTVAEIVEAFFNEDAVKSLILALAARSLPTGVNWKPWFPSSRSRSGSNPPTRIDRSSFFITA